MEKFYGLVIGERVNVKHLDKVSTKYGKYFDNATTEQKQNSVEVWLELHDLHSPSRDFITVIPVVREYLPRYIEIMSNLPFLFELCYFRHGHVSSSIGNCTYNCKTFVSLHNMTYFLFESENESDSGLSSLLIYTPLQKQFHIVPRLVKGDEYETEFSSWLQSIMNDSPFLLVTD